MIRMIINKSEIYKSITTDNNMEIAQEMLNEMKDFEINFLEELKYSECLICIESYKKGD